MSIELRVRPSQQPTPWACWWTCMAMVLEYYGHPFYRRPARYQPEFRRPWNQPYSVMPDMRYPADAEEILSRGGRIPNDAVFAEPYEWFAHGLPANPRAFRLLSRITGFRGIDERPAFGTWTAEYIESRLRSHGPYIFFGFWNGFPHAILTIGLIGSRTAPSVVTIDPARGFQTSEPIDQFNARMRSKEMKMFTALELNPLHLPQADPVRDVISL